MLFFVAKGCWHFFGIASFCCISLRSLEKNRSFEVDKYEEVICGPVHQKLEQVYVSEASFNPRLCTTSSFFTYTKMFIKHEKLSVCFWHLRKSTCPKISVFPNFSVSSCKVQWMYNWILVSIMIEKMKDHFIMLFETSMRWIWGSSSIFVLIFRNGMWLFCF